MKTSKIITTIASLNLVLFMSVSSIAKPFTHYEGDIIKSSVNKQIGVVKSTIIEITSPASSQNEFSHLRFDINKFKTESEVTVLPLNTLDYLHFDANNFSYGITSEITELPVMNEFNHLRFDINNFDSSSDLSEMPADEFDYLRFDVDNYTYETSAAIDELPVN